MLTREQLMADRMSALCATPASPFSYAVNNQVKNKDIKEQLKHKRNPKVFPVGITSSVWGKTKAITMKLQNR